MDNIKDKYSMRFFLSTVAFFLDFVLAFFSIREELNIFLIIFFIIIDIYLFFISYQSLMNRLALRNKFNKVYESKISLKDEFNKKTNRKKKVSKIINNIFIISLYISPILMIIFILIGVYMLENVALSIVAPAFLISYLVILFFIKDIYSKEYDIDDINTRSIVFINKKSITYKGVTFIFNYCGFHFRNGYYKFLFIPLSKPKFGGELDKLITEYRENEICD